jgi:phosphoribosylanthranilate isomerase
MNLSVKICGMRDTGNIREAAELKPDIMGFIFYRSSSRYAGDSLTKETLSSVHGNIKKAGVFVNSNYDEIMTLSGKYSLDMIQLHGDEPSELCIRLKKSGLQVIKVFRIEKELPLTQFKDYKDCTDYFLFDTGTDKFGGSGQKFRWELLDDTDVGHPFFLSGGIGPDDAGKIAAINNPFFHGIDLNSRFEISPGIKDIEKLRTFIQEVRDK